MHALKTYTATEPLTVFDPVLRQIQRQSLKLHLFAQIVLNLLAGFRAAYFEL